MKSAMLAKIIMARDLDEVLERYHIREIERHLDPDCMRTYNDFSLTRDSDKLWSDLRSMAEDKLAKLFDAMPEEA